MLKEPAAPGSCVGVAERARRIAAPWPPLAAAALLIAICGAAYGATLAPGISWANGGADGAELAAAALVGGVPHPTGYPTYLLLARLALLPPLGEPARALALLSAAAATLAALAVGDTVRRLAGAAEPWASLAGLLAALGLALAPPLWSQAVIAEVYAPAALGAALLLRAALLAGHEGPRPLGPAERLTALLAGAALGLHLTNLPFALAWLAVASRAPRPPDWLGRLAGLAPWGAAGLLVFLALPLRAAAEPPISWGGADTWAGFWWLVSGRLYAGMALGLPIERLPARLAEWGAPLAPLAWAGLPLCLWGLIAGGRPTWGLRAITAGLAALCAAFALGFASLDAQAYLIPALLPAAIWLGLGAARALDAAARRGPSFAAAAALALAAGLLWPAPLTARLVDASADRRAIVYAERILAAAPAGAVILADDDRGLFPLWYEHFGRGRRPDLRVVAAPLLSFAWYRASLGETYPDLELPAAPPREGWEAALGRAPRPLCRASAEPAPALACAGLAQGSR